MKIQDEPDKTKKSKWASNSGGQSDMREIMSKLNLTKAQRGKMMGIWPQLGKKKEELTNKGMTEGKVTKQVNQFFEDLFVKLLTDEQLSKFYILKSSQIKKAYQMVDKEPSEFQLSVGLKAGGFTEILNSEVKEGDEFISKVIINESTKKALRLF